MPVGFHGMLGVSTSVDEWREQRTSFGPMQIMGAVAREYGYKGKLSALNGSPGVHYGVKHFHNLYVRHNEKHGLEGVVSAYNCGQPKPESNPAYVLKVLTFAKQYK